MVNKIDMVPGFGAIVFPFAKTASTVFRFGCIGSLLLLRGLSLVAASGGYSSLWCSGFSLRWILLLRSTGSRRAGAVAPRHVGSSWTRDRTCVPCIGRRILNHCATRAVPQALS